MQQFLSISCSDIVSSLYTNSSLSDQTLVFGDHNLHVCRNVLASSSNFFLSLWYMEFADKYENPVDFSHLAVSGSSFVAFISALYGVKVDVSESNVYDLFYLAHYFQADGLITQIELVMTQNLVNWTWLLCFLLRADENDDFRALKIAGPYLKMSKDILIDVGVNLKTDSIQLLTKFCDDRQLQSWLVRSLVVSICNLNFELSEFLSILNHFNLSVFSLKDWENLLFDPLRGIKELEQPLREFLFDKLKVLYFDSLLNQVEELKKQNSELVSYNERVNKTIESIKSAFKVQGEQELFRILSDPISSSVIHISSSVFDVVQNLDKCFPENLSSVSKVTSTALFRYFLVNYINSGRDRIGDRDLDKDNRGPCGLDPVAAVTTISQQILEFITQLLEPDVKASHLESIYSGFNEEEMSNEMEILSHLDPSGKLQKKFFLISNHGSIVTNVSGIFSSIKVSTSIVDRRINSGEELSSDSLLSDFGSYSKKFSSMIDCSHCNRTSPPLYFQIFQLLNNADDLLSILNKYSTLTFEELSSKLYGNFAASYTVNSSIAQFFISMLDDPKSLWNFVLKPIFDDGVMRQLLRNLHDWMKDNCHSPQRVAADVKSINQLKSAIKAIDELLVSDGDQSALINIISKCNFQEGILLFNLETITVSLQLPTGEDSTIDVPEEEFHRARAEGLRLKAVPSPVFKMGGSSHTFLKSPRDVEEINCLQLIFPSHARYDIFAEYQVSDSFEEAHDTLLEDCPTTCVSCNAYIKEGTGHSCLSEAIDWNKVESLFQGMEHSEPSSTDVSPRISKTFESHPTQQLYDENGDQFLNMCQLVDETLFILRQLVDCGFPIKSDEPELIVKVEEHNSGIQQQVETLRELRDTWMTLLEQAQNGWFRGMHPKEISNFLLNRQVSDIVRYFHLSGLDCNSIQSIKNVQSGIDSCPSVSDTLQEVLNFREPSSVEIKGQSITYFQSDSLSNLFTDVLKIAVHRNTELNIRNVLICNWETSFSSLVAVMSDSLVSERLIIGFDQLRFSVREKFYTYMKDKNEENFKISVVGCGSDFLYNTHSVLGTLLSEVDLSSVLESCSVGAIYTSAVPGQGKTTRCLRECVPEGLVDTHTKTCNVSGKVNISEFIEKYLRDDKIDWSNPNIHLDIRQPLDVLKRTFTREHWTSSSKLTSQDFYNTAYILFSLSFLSGLRHNGSIFRLENKIYIEFASYNYNSKANLTPFNWYNSLIDSLYPNKDDLVNELSFDFYYFKLTSEAMKAHVATISRFLSILLNSPSSLEPLFTNTFADLPPPHQSQWSFRLLTDIVSLLGSQLNYFDQAVAFSPEIMTLSGYSDSQIDDIRRCGIDLIFGFSRQTVLMSVPTISAPDRDEVVVNWNDMNHVMFMLTRESPSITVPRGSNVPNALKSYVESNPSFGCSLEIPPTDEGKISKIRSFTFDASVPPTAWQERFGNYALTGDAFLKQTLIALRFSANLPTILRGASGVGKTHLLECLSFILFWNETAENPNLWEELFVNVTVNAGTELHEVEDTIKRVNNLALLLPPESPLFPILFLDECNASDFLGLVSGLITNRKLGTLSLHPKVRLVAAINPYQKGNDDKLLYNVHPEPSCLIPLMMDFGKLSERDEEEYVVKIAKRSDLVSICSTPEITTLAKTLSRIHKCLSNRSAASSVPWMISLRDAVRATRILKFLIEFKNSLAPEFIFFSEQTFSHLLLLTVYVCYILRLPTKDDQNSLLTVICSELRTSPYIARQRITTTLSQFVDLGTLPEGVRQTTYFLENTFAMFLALISRTPIIIIGAPGTSKSLSLTVLLTFLSKVNTAESGFHRIFPHHFQGSHAATTKSVMTVVDRVKKNAIADTNVRQALIMDNSSLLLDAPANPLKCLHSVLEPREEKSTPVCFYCRAIVIHRQEPSDAELTALLKEIGQHRGTKIPALLTKIHMLMKSKADKLYPCHGNQFYGMRDAYQLAKWLNVRGGVSHKDRRIAFLRAYGGLPWKNNAVFEVVSTIFAPEKAKRVKNEFGTDINLFFDRSIPRSYRSQLEKESLKACYSSVQDPSPDSRHILFIGSLQHSLYIIRRSRKDVDIVVVQGSRFEKDAYNDVSYNHLSKVITAVKLGKVIVLSGTEHIIGALFDLINKNYLRKDAITGDALCRVALGPVSNSLCHVNERTKIILVVSEENLKSTPPTLLNRMEKFVLSDLVNVKESTADIERLFDDLGVLKSLPKCLITDSQIRQNFLSDLQLVENLRLERLHFLANLAHVVSSNNHSNVGPFLTLAHALDHLSSLDVLQQHPLKVVALSKVFGQSFDSLPGYDSVKIANLSSVSESRDLESLLKNTGIEIIQKLLDEDAPETAKSLLAIRIEGDEAKHYDFIENINVYEVLKKHFSNHADPRVFLKYLLNFDIVIAIINGEDLQISPLSSFIAVYCDSINLVQ
ncbi:hypothetical protein GEMRC1_001644 [Eukaryota sp. GEM-RC1]